LPLPLQTAASRSFLTSATLPFISPAASPAGNVETTSIFLLQLIAEEDYDNADDDDDDDDDEEEEYDQDLLDSTDDQEVDLDDLFDDDDDESTEDETVLDYEPAMNGNKVKTAFLFVSDLRPWFPNLPADVGSSASTVLLTGALN